MSHIYDTDPKNARDFRGAGKGSLDSSTGLALPAKQFQLPRLVNWFSAKTATKPYIN